MAASMSHVTGPSKRIYAKFKRFSNYYRRTYSSGEYKTEYDLIVVGGGSGGLACAKEAAFHGRKVAVLDFVNASAKGSSWGLGGTCVNVGCIPKKLMHQAALVGRSVRDAHHYGWDVPGTQPNLSWSTLSSAVQNYVRSLNWGHRVQLNQRNVDYFNAFGRFVDRHTIKATDKQGNEIHLKSKEFVIAVGMRPKIPSEVSGAREHAITSDDLFWMKESPGKTLVIGASYVALECAGFLTGLGCPTSLLIRSIPLRGFDQQMAGLIVDNMAGHGTVIHRRSVPQQIVKKDGLLKVTWKHIPTSVISTETFNTVLMAVGREAQTKSIGLTDVGVELDQETGQVIGGHSGESEKSSVDNIYAIGDILHGAPELTPVAVLAGKLLARRLAGMTSEQMDYSAVPTTVFTPLEYGSVGLSEEQALQTLGEDEIEVHHAFYKPLEYAVPGESASQCYIKVISKREMPRKVLGLHFLGPSAGEVVQGFALSMRCGLTVCSLQRTVGIHPTCAEEIVKLHITKRSGFDPVVTGC